MTEMQEHVQRRTNETILTGLRIIEFGDGGIGKQRRGRIDRWCSVIVKFYQGRDRKMDNVYWWRVYGGMLAPVDACGRRQLK